MSTRVSYLDSSALVKLVIDEAESASLRAWVGDRQRTASCALATTEVLRAVHQYGAAVLTRARAALSGLALIALDDGLLETAATLDPAIFRSLDAIHLAAALSLGADLDVVVSYDTRMLEGARLLGFPTERPA